MCNQYLLRLFVHKLRTDPTLSCRAYRGSLGLQVRLDREETRSVTYCDKLLYIWLDVIWKVFRLCSAWFWQCGAKIKLQRRGSDLARPPALFRQKSLWIHFNLAASLSKVFQNTFCLLWAFHFLCLLLFFHKLLPSLWFVRTMCFSMSIQCTMESRNHTHYLSLSKGATVLMCLL